MCSVMLRGAGAGTGNRADTRSDVGWPRRVCVCGPSLCGTVESPFAGVSRLIDVGRRLVYLLRRSDTEVEWCVEAWAGSPRFFFHHAISDAGGQARTVG